MLLHHPTPETAHAGTYRWTHHESYATEKSLRGRSRPPTNRRSSPCHPHVMGKTNTTEQNKQIVWRCPEAQTKRKGQRHSAHRLNSGTVKKNASSAGGPKILAQSRISPESWVVD